MELMDIKWCMASVMRRVEKFKQITGRDDFRDANVSTLGFDKSKVTCFRCRERDTSRESAKIVKLLVPRILLERTIITKRRFIVKSHHQHSIRHKLLMGEM
ncbi:hypothetical protein HanXRQr2_Chr04g0153751 [Helianthus annuus]|uniref:Uncharacterized protein n=1 Tax=Helianthus annuus TaxID=4232 RepID=A0A9K3J6B7_HELAN|nr:hypothetical protein HanXRQr2_Chr04g0153751 [Helianthus annuus]KAJ0930332.1 hypothetical protein HanPSC8_Chr04g0148051 [Helianthus annuus]